MSNIRTGFKVLTHDYRSPLRVGEPIWDGVTLPYTLPSIQLDIGSELCGEGWHYCDRLSTAFLIAGLWRHGRPSTALVVEADESAIERDGKRRAAGLTIVARATEADIAMAIREISESFGDYADEMARETLAWYTALGRPLYDVEKVVHGLTLALKTRGLAWKMRQFASAMDVWSASMVPNNKGRRYAPRSAWSTDVALATKATHCEWYALGLYPAWRTMNTGYAWPAKDVSNALAFYYSSRIDWIGVPLDYLSAGIREAYRYGLGFALPTGPAELGWAMDNGGRERDSAYADDVMAVEGPDNFGRWSV